jgi:hypothetical protein
MRPVDPYNVPVAHLVPVSSMRGWGRDATPHLVPVPAVNCARCVDCWGVLPFGLQSVSLRCKQCANRARQEETR